MINNFDYSDRSIAPESTSNSIISYTSTELDLLARLMRAEAVGEGELGMLMVGNVVVNRVICGCLDFKNVNTITQAIYQTPNSFSGVNSALFKTPATASEKVLAQRCINGETFYPATNALWFYAPKVNEACKPLWYNQPNAGRYKNHCFYKPNPNVCPNLY